MTVDDLAFLVAMGGAVSGLIALGCLVAFVLEEAWKGLRRIGRWLVTVWSETLNGIAESVR